jgi:hypothetical protein
MKRALIAALASLMLAGVLAGASEPVSKIAPSAIFALGGDSSPVFVNAPFAATYGDSTSH